MTAAGQELRPARTKPAFQCMLLCMAVAWILAAMMAGLSAVDAHPDEASHIAAGEYYVTEWLPPRATEAALLPSLSTYGYTYLSSVDVTYFLGGKLASLLAGIFPCEHLCFRAFNLLLFLVLIVWYAIRRDAFSPLVLLLVTPQVWYVFSYFNNDGLPLFLALLLADAVFGSRSRLGDALSTPWRASSLGPLVCSGAVIGLLALTKSNYLPFIGFVVFVGFWKALGLAAAAIAVASAGPYLAYARGFGSVPPLVARASLALGIVATLATVSTKAWHSQATRTLLVRAAVIALAALAVAVPPLVYDRITNGEASDKASVMSAIAEKHAEPEYRPSSAADSESFFGLRLRDKGVAVYELLLEPWDWPVKTWKSFTGYYGYMTIHGPAAYYVVMFALHLLMLSCTARVLFVRGEPAEWQLFAMAGVFGGGIILLSLYHSWINDFQAQGRYLFPVLALFAIPFTRASRWFDARVVPALIGAAFVLSCSSFLFVGLREIAKAPCW